MKMRRGDEEPAVSYRQLRTVIGGLGALLPLVVTILGTGPVKQSISAYYYSNSRDFFVGLLCLTGVFLICYHGYKDDPPVSIFAGIAALGVAFFPMSPPVDGQGMLDGKAPPPLIGLFNLSPDYSGYAHYAFAIGLFSLLAYMCGCLFTKTWPSQEVTVEKLRRNSIYRLCARVMLVAMAVEGANLAYWYFAHRQDPSRMLLWVETVCLVAFSLSWLVKGEKLPIAFLRDHGAAPTEKLGSA